MDERDGLNEVYVKLESKTWLDSVEVGLERFWRSIRASNQEKVRFLSNLYQFTMES